MTRRRSGLTVAVMAAGSIALFSSPAHAGHGVNCSDFDTQDEAQEYFEEHGPGDPEGLDRDNDGMACDSLPGGGGNGGGGNGGGGNGGGGNGGGGNGGGGNGGGGGGGGTMPRGGVEAGAGGMADPTSPALPAAGAVLGTALLGAGVMTVRRRATAK